MALNPTKSNVILFGTSKRLKTMSSLSSVKLDDSVIQFSDAVKNLGARLDSSLTMGPHTKATSKSCFYHICSFSQIRLSMDHTMAISVASALVSSRLDCANSVLFGCLQKHAARLQRAQQALARVVMQQSSVSPVTSTELLKQLHWLPIEWRIRFKLACLVHKILNTGHLPCLTELLQYHKPSRSTRSSASHLLSVPRHKFHLCSRFPRRCAQNMELHTSSHPPISNILFLQTSS